MSMITIYMVSILFVQMKYCKLYSKRSIILVLILDGNGYSLEGSFRGAISPILLFFQLFGIMPLNGVTNHSVTDLRFEWKSVRTIYSLFIVMFLLAYSVVFILDLITNILTLQYLGQLMKMKSNSRAEFIFYSRNIYINRIAILVDSLFNTLNTIAFIGFIGLAMKWSELIKIWENAESNLTMFCKHRISKRFTFKIRMVASVMLLMGLSIEFVI